ncbi:MAG: AraC family transcriptional regulator [Pseudaminobacter sp.]|nr:AraC family transcriptional regulator [Pseudaminobacter sp.]
MKNRQFRMLRSRSPGVEAVEAETRHVFPRHTHDRFGIGVIHRGAQKSLSGRGMVEAVAGDTITVNPGEVHDGAPIGDASRSWRMLYFDPALIADAVGDMSQGKAGACEFSRPAFRDGRVARDFQNLFRMVTAAGVETAVEREESLLILLAGILGEDNRFDKGRLVPQTISSAKNLIDDDPAAAITLADLARESGLSRFQVLRGFVKATGLTPHAYLVQRRIDIARRLIAQAMPLAEAANAAGFADQSHMTRLFVRKYGLSPGAYARAVT